jgi:phosphoribosylformylglycinamidine cyclo-ligase
MDAEMHRVFNCGIGMVIVVPADQAEAISATLAAHGEEVSQLGEIVPQDGADAPQTVVV